MQLAELKPGQRIRIRQLIDRREGAWRADVEGEVLEILEEPTGSWFAHAKDDRLWLRRIRLRKPNGEITTITLDQYSQLAPL
jgi:hypothetical protein